MMVLVKYPAKLIEHEEAPETAEYFPIVHGVWPVAPLEVAFVPIDAYDPESVPVQALAPLEDEKVPLGHGFEDVPD